MANVRPQPSLKSGSFTNNRKVASSSNASRQLTLNFSPIMFEDREISIGVTPYQSKEQLQALRLEHADTHVFHRDNSNQILSVSTTPEGVAFGEATLSIKLSENLQLCATLARAAIVKFLHRLNRKVLGYKPIEFISDLADDNFLKSVLPSETDLSNWLSVKPLYTITVRTVSFDHQTPSLGLALNVRTSSQIELPCDVLLKEGLSLTGLYVGQLVSSEGSLFAPYLKTLGRVQAVEEGQLILTDTRLGFDTIAASEVFLDPRREAFNRCLEHALGFSKMVQVKEALDNKLSAFRSGPNRLKRLQTVVEFFARHPQELLPGTTFTFAPFLAEAESENFPTVQVARPPTYVFDPTDPTGPRTSTWNDGGLSEYGPYTAQTFTPTTPRVCVICQRTQKGRVEQFLYKFLKGVTVPKLERQPFAKGFILKYLLDGFETHFFLAEDSTAASYDRAVRQALNEQRRESLRWDLALIQTEEAFHQLLGDDNPYLITKATFLGAQIPVQEFEIETIDVRDQSLCYVLNNIGLAIYAKLGGIPWLIRANPPITHELVFGLGSASIGEGRFGRRERVVGITTVFSGDGNYRLSNLSQAVPMSEYKDALLESLRETIGNIQRSMNWQPRERVRLVFHAFKPLKDAEAEAVKRLMAELGDYDVEYAFIHIVDDHPYLLFDQAQSGVWDYETRTRTKGAFAPTRGVFFRLSRSEVLLSLTGAKELKRSQDGIPAPVLLRLHRESTFQDTTYLARQIFTFSCHSWRSFFPSPKPVTTLYSGLIARMLGQLGTVSRWNPDAMLSRIGATRWFL